MAAYVIIKIREIVPSLLKAYQRVTPSIIEKYKGKFLARGGKIVTFEGKTENRRVVIIEFPCLNDAKKFYYSDEYKKAIEFRSMIAEAEIIAIDGISCTGKPFGNTPPPLTDG